MEPCLTHTQCQIGYFLLLLPESFYSTDIVLISPLRCYFPGFVSTKGRIPGLGCHFLWKWRTGLISVATPASARALSLLWLCFSFGRKYVALGLEVWEEEDFGQPVDAVPHSPFSWPVCHSDATILQLPCSGLHGHLLLWGVVSATPSHLTSRGPNHLILLP